MKFVCIRHTPDGEWPVMARPKPNTCSNKELCSCAQASFTLKVLPYLTFDPSLGLLRHFFHKTSGPWNGIGLALSNKDGPTFEGVSASYTRRKAAPMS
eukprot:454947-Pelagomonas_calceolata.AAC.1